MINISDMQIEKMIKEYESMAVYQVTDSKDKYYLKRKCPYRVYSEVIGSYVFKRTNPNSILYHFAKKKDESTLYSICRDLEIKDLTASHSLKIVKKDYLAMVRTLSYQENGKEEISKLYNLLISDLSILNTDRHFTNIPGYYSDDQFYISDIIDFDDSFGTKYLCDKYFYRDYMDSISSFMSDLKDETKLNNIYLNTNPKYPFNNGKKIEDFIRYLIENNICIDKLIDISNLPYGDIIQEVEDMENYLIPDDIKKLFIALGNLRKEQVRVILR